MVKLLIIFVLAILMAFSAYMESKSSNVSYLKLPGGWGLLFMGLMLSTFIVLIVFGILYITGQ